MVEGLRAARPKVSHWQLTVTPLGILAGGEQKGLTVNVWAFEVPPPGDGLTTVMESVAAVAKSLVVMATVSCVELT